MLPRELRQLARLYGIHTEYTSMRRERRQADVDSVLAVLKAMGVPIRSVDEATDAMKARLAELKNRKVEPVIVAWDGKLEGHKKLSPGYHELKIHGQETFVISAPTKAFLPDVRSWGLFAPVYALHSRRNPTIGNLSEFETLLDWMHPLGGRIGATLPLLAAYLDQPFEPSPYAPASRLFWNELYIDVSRVPEFARNLRAQQLAERRPRKSEFIDYRSEMAYKRAILEELAKTFFESGNVERKRSFAQFRKNKNVEDYAGFRAATDRLQKGWNLWPSRLRNGELRHNDYDQAAKNYHLYTQWIVQEQLAALSHRAAAKGQLLYLDLPLGLHTDSYDIWRNRDFFVTGVSGGAPPDLVFTKGQNWGFPPMHPEAMRLNQYQYQYMIAYIRNHLRYARLLRIDHVMGLHRLFWIPEGMSGDKGVYVEYPADELYAILSLESHLHQAGIVGENLGTVPREVDKALDRHNIQKMFVVQYEAVLPAAGASRHPLPEGEDGVPRNCVASLNTHDMPPFEAFVKGADIDDRVDLRFLDRKDAGEERRHRGRIKNELVKFFRTTEAGLFQATIRWLARSMANIVLINAEDLWQEVLPQNVPATNNERPNWRRRFRPSVEQILRNPDVSGVLSDVSAERSRSVSL